MNWKYTTHHGKSTSCEWLVSRRVVSVTSEHHQHVVVYSWYFPCVGSAQQQCMSSPSRPSDSLWSLQYKYLYPIHDMSFSFSWTVLLFSYIHSYIQHLHQQMFTCVFAVDEDSLLVFQHVNSSAMQLNMSLRLPGSPQSLPDGTTAQKAELKALIPHTTKVEARNQYRLNVQVHCVFFV